MKTILIRSDSMRFAPTPPTLDELRPGDEAEILAVDAADEFRHRLRALGLSAGKQVRMLRSARWGGPVHVRIDTTELMLRLPEARQIRIAIRPAT